MKDRISESYSKFLKNRRTIIVENEVSIGMIFEEL